MPLLDVLLVIFITLLIGLLAFYVRFRFDSGRYLAFWGAAHLLSAVNIAQQAFLRGYAGGLSVGGLVPVLSILVAGLILAGAVELRGRRAGWQLFVPLAALMLAAALGAAFADPRLVISASAFTICLILVITAFVLWRGRRMFHIVAAGCLSMRAAAVAYVGYTVLASGASAQLSPAFFGMQTLLSGLALLLVALDAEQEKKLQAERNVTETQALMQAIIDAVPAAINFKTPDLRYAYVNRVFAEQFGRRRPLLGKTAPEVFDPELLRDHLADEQQALQSVEAVPFRTFQQPATGKSWWMTRKALRRADGSLLGLVTVGVDISEQQRVVQKLGRAQKLARAGWFEFRASDNTFSLEPGMAELLGMESKPRYSNRDFFERVESSAVAEFRDVARRAIREGRSYYFDAWFTNAARRRFWLHMEAAPKFDAAGNYIGSEGFLQDLTGLKQREDALRQKELQLVRSQRIESIGRLAGGIAHDFNNILAAISGFAELIRQDAAPGSTVANFVDRILRSSDRGRQVVRQLLAYARADTVERTVIDLAAVIREVIDLARAMIPTSTNLELDCPTGPLYMLANEGQIHQLLLNLCMNSNDAMAGRPGKLRVVIAPVRIAVSDAMSFCSAGPSSRGGGVIGVGDLLPDQTYLRIEIQDNGPGMAWDVLRRWDEPFFTTKEVGRGTGLGLVIVKGIVEAYGGAICIESTLGSGTRVSIYLPLDPAQIKGGEADLAPAAAGAPVRGNVLVVDDEIDVRDATVIALQRAGHSVSGSSDPLEALERIRGNPGVVDVLVTDNIMPGIKGMELIAEARRLDPAMRAILCTGFSDGATERSAREAGADLFFEKPVSGKDITEAVGRLLAGKR